MQISWMMNVRINWMSSMRGVCASWSFLQLPRHALPIFYCLTAIYAVVGHSMALSTRKRSEIEMEKFFMRFVWQVCILWQVFDFEYVSEWAFIDCSMCKYKKATTMTIPKKIHKLAVFFVLLLLLSLVSTPYSLLNCGRFSLILLVSGYVLFVKMETFSINNWMRRRARVCVCIGVGNMHTNRYLWQLI